MKPDIRQLEPRTGQPYAAGMSGPRRQLWRADATLLQQCQSRRPLPAAHRVRLQTCRAVVAERLLEARAAVLRHLG